MQIRKQQAELSMFASVRWHLDAPARQVPHVRLAHLKGEVKLRDKAQQQNDDDEEKKVNDCKRHRFALSCCAARSAFQTSGNFVADTARLTAMDTRAFTRAWVSTASKVKAKDC